MTAVLEKEEIKEETTLKRGRPPKEDKPVQDTAPDYRAWGEQYVGKLRTAQGQEHGCIETLANGVPDHGFKGMSEPNRKEMLALKAKALRPVPYTYYHLKNQTNGKWEGWYGVDWPGEPMRCFRLLHGQTYMLPAGLKWKIDEMGSPKRSGLVGPDGVPLAIDGEKEKTHMLVRAD